MTTGGYIVVICNLTYNSVKVSEEGIFFLRGLKFQFQNLLHCIVCQNCLDWVSVINQQHIDAFWKSMKQLWRLNLTWLQQLRELIHSQIWVILILMTTLTMINGENEAVCWRERWRTGFNERCDVISGENANEGSIYLCKGYVPMS